MKFKIKLIILITLLLLLQFFFVITSLADDENLSMIGSPSAILIESSTGKILYEKNSNKKMYPASTTKIMTAILTVEHCKLTDIATVSHNAIYTVPVGYAHANLVEGEELTIEQLLNVLLIPSANDAANVLAEHLGGSVENFATMMNEKAKEIGCKNTHFVNPNGVHNNNHYSTAYDLALMGQYAMKSSTIRSIVKKTQYSLPKTNKYNKDNRIFNTSNDLLRENYSNRKDNYYYKYANGIKTGYTTEAGSCIIAGASKDNLDVIAVVLGAETTKDGYSIRYPDCKTLFNYAFDNYKVENIIKEKDVIKEIQIPDASKESANLKISAKNDITAVIPKNISSDLNPTIDLKEGLSAPISIGETVGKVTYTINNTKYSSDLVANSNVIKSGFWDILFKICAVVLIIAVLYLILKPKKRNNKRKKKSKKSKKSNYKHLRM